MFLVANKGTLHGKWGVVHISKSGWIHQCPSLANEGARSCVSAPRQGSLSQVTRCYSSALPAYVTLMVGAVPAGEEAPRPSSVLGEASSPSLQATWQARPPSALWRFRGAGERLACPSGVGPACCLNP